MSKLLTLALPCLAWLLLAAPAVADDAPAPQAVTPAAVQAPPLQGPAKGPEKGPEKGLGKNDRLDLDPTSIRGNQELPKVLYIVPWKESGPGQPAGRPVNSLIDEALAPVDREVFRRQVGYFDQLYPAPGSKAGGGGASP